MKNRILIIIGVLMLMTVTAVAAKEKFTLVIDPGHGGNDAGAIGRLTKEKIINLNVALAFGRLVERNCADVKVVYTRKTDVFIPLHTRADIANRNKADLFISIHTNALPKGSISRGLETYTLGMHRAADNLEVAKRENEVILYEKDYKQRYQGFDPNSSESYIMFEFMQDHNMAQSVELAKFVQSRTCAAASRQNKGVKQAGFLVLRETSMPSCLIELGFISTPDEERFLNSSSGVSRLASGIYQAFLDYKRKYDGHVAVPLKAEPQPEVTIPTVVPQDEVKDKKEKKKRKKSKMAQELEDAREGRGASLAESKPSAPSVDSIIAAAPVAAVPETAVAQVAPAAPATETPTPAPVAPVMAAPVAEAQPSKADTDSQAGQTAQKVQASQASQTVQTSQTVQNNQSNQIVQVNEPTPSRAEKKSQPVQEPKQTVGKVAPVFKVQIMACDIMLRPKDPRLKGVTDASYYQEGGYYKYTVGASTNYTEISNLRRTLAAKFPQAFIVAFKNGQKVNVQTAIQEFKANKK